MQRTGGGWVGLFLRVALYATLAVAGMVVFGLAASFWGYLVAAALGTFLAAAVANALMMNIFERASVAHVGLMWNEASRRNLLLGLIGGTGGACMVLVPPLLLGWAQWRATEGESGLDAALFLFVTLLFGAVGEELLFRGYAFQVLLHRLGPYGTIFPTSVLFALAHAGNLNVTPLALCNTGLWGVLLGFAFLRSGDLWLPIGLHFGWNLALPLFGVNLSGFTMRVTGYAMEWKVGPLWSGGAYGPEGGLLTCVALGALFWFLRRAPVIRQKAFLLEGCEGI
ncbi:MAG: CPBP family intramembrane glutamic endopeptidase [Bryobacterales bacterium]|nr:CPBP family intramembrane metalloprotease [Bryobacteraceae bacterium]MDW8353431.1 CPBP family intramembrane glutamic endopeptidase [Bryobacterales bacterium]